MIVIDASLLLGQIRGEREALAAVAAATTRTSLVAMHAPELIELELLQALRRLLQIGVITAEQARTALANLAGLRLQRHAHAPLRLSMWALRDRLTAYDASYVALAERLGADLLLTADKGMAAVAREVLGADRVRLV